MNSARKIGSLTLNEVISSHITSSNENCVIWSCTCDCGESFAFCACLTSNHKHTHTISRVVRNSPEFRSWSAMLRRCGDKNNPYYGARGIRVCERWKFFPHFLKDMGRRPKNMTLDRINPDGNYEPSNCRWATAAEQQRNTRKMILKLTQMKEAS